MQNLELLHLYENYLSGEIPAELGQLTGLKALGLSGNLLSGCIPGGLREIESNDLDDLELPDC